MVRNASQPITYSEDSTEIVPIYVGYGFLTQAGYLFKNNWEIAARYAEITPYASVYSENQLIFPSVNEKKQQHIQLGVTKYLYGHRVKIQGNLLYHLSTNMRSEVTTGKYGVIFQVELGI